MPYRRGFSLVCGNTAKQTYMPGYTKSGILWDELQVNSKWKIVEDMNKTAGICPCCEVRMKLYMYK